MDDFTRNINTRMKKLRTELSQLRAAKVAYVAAQIVKPVKHVRRHNGMTIQKRILDVLDDSEPMKASEILQHIKQDMPTLERTSLSPQLSRLKQSDFITNSNGLWRLTSS